MMLDLSSWALIGAPVVGDVYDFCFLLCFCSEKYNIFSKVLRRIEVQFDLISSEGSETMRALQRIQASTERGVPQWCMNQTH